MPSSRWAPAGSSPLVNAVRVTRAARYIQRQGSHSRADHAHKRCSAERWFTSNASGSRSSLWILTRCGSSVPLVHLCSTASRAGCQVCLKYPVPKPGMARQQVPAPPAPPSCIAAISAAIIALQCSGCSWSSSVQSSSGLPAACLLKTAAHLCPCRPLPQITSSCGDCLLQLRSGFIFENQFLSGLSMAGLDKHLRPQHLQA